MGRWSRVFVVSSSLVVASSGCGESFTTTGGAGGTSSGGGGAGGATGGGGTGGTTTSTPDCTQGETRPCYSGKMGTEGVGLCKAGVNKCVSGSWSDVCDGQVTPEATETCDGADNNCNGKTDEGCSCTDGDKQSCTAGGTNGVGICKDGEQTCASGTWDDCVGAVGPGVETCANQGVDDDCNGTKDDIPNAGTGCDTGGAGVCNAGTRHCVGDTLTCVQNVQPTGETCANQGADNDCNGTKDDVLGIGLTCTFNSPQGVVCTGFTKCMGGNAPSCGPAVYFSEDFSNPQNWQLDNEWQLGVAMAGSGHTAGDPDPGMDHTPNNNDNKLAGVALGGNAENLIHEPFYLTSKVIDINKATPVFLTFFRWLNSNATTQMIDTVDVSMDGGNQWSNLWTNKDGAVFDTQWVPVALDVTLYKSANFRFRFGFEVVDTGPIVSSWNIDDVALMSCPSPP